MIQSFLDFFWKCIDCNRYLGSMLVGFSIVAGIFSCWIFDGRGTPSELFTLIGGGIGVGTMLVQSGVNQKQAKLENEKQLELKKLDEVKTP